MKFWEVTAFDTEVQQEVQFRVAADVSYPAAKVKGILREVHSEYQNIRLKRIKKIPGFDAFEQ
jgi:hypothetical protein|tara:strand:+ start:1373 stop:1561 length:189 start_codon:yes stop_codon:yes gene_type:complete